MSQYAVAPNARRDGWRVSTYSGPGDLIDEAVRLTHKNGTNVSAVIREALENYVREHGDQ